MVLPLLQAVFSGIAAFFFVQIFGDLNVLICKPDLLPDFRWPALIFRDPG